MTCLKVKSAIAAEARCRRRRSSRKAMFARGRALLAAAALLALAFVAIGDRPTAAAPALAEPVTTVALLGVQFLNDHADLEPTTDAERARLASIKELFESDLQASGRYRFAPIPADAAGKIAAGPEIGNCAR